MRYLDRLKYWANNRGYTIVEHKRSRIDTGDKLIFINKKLDYNRQLYELAHECGHELVFHTKYQNKYPALTKLDARANENLRKSKVAQVECIKEEMEAWDKGEKLLQRLGIKYNQEEYKKHAAKCIFTYIEGAYYRL